MRRYTAVSILLLATFCSPRSAEAQDARQRQAAAEAYDRGTAAYLEGSYGEAAQWFETAHRMAPAAPALMQAIRAHEHANNHTRAATLALELSRSYSEQSSATDYAKGVLEASAPKLLQVQVSCDEDCKLDVDGKLQEFLAFFEEPGRPHTLTATFETGSKTTKVQGEAGESRQVSFEAPPPPPAPLIGPSEGSATEMQDTGTSGRPLAPLYTFIGIGVTTAVLAGTIVSMVDMNRGVPEYNQAADEYTSCAKAVGSRDCGPLERHAKALYEQGQSKELRTNILIGATAFAAVSTGVIALFLTDWSAESESDDDSAVGLRNLRIEPRPGGLQTTLQGRF
jgi:hypothetical protein